MTNKEAQAKAKVDAFGDGAEWRLKAEARLCAPGLSLILKLRISSGAKLVCYQNESLICFG